MTNITITEVRTAIDGFGADHLRVHGDTDRGIAQMTISHADDSGKRTGSEGIFMNVEQIDVIMAGLAKMKQALVEGGKGGASSDHQLPKDLMVERAARLVRDADSTYPSELRPRDGVIVTIDGVEYFDRILDVVEEGSRVTLALRQLGSQSVPSDVRLPAVRA